MKSPLFRIAHLGYYDYLDTIGIIAALEQVMARIRPVEFGAAVVAAQKGLRGQASGKRKREI